MPLIFSKSKGTCNYSARSFTGSTGAEVLIDNCDPYLVKNAPSFSSDFTLCNSRNSSTTISYNHGAEDCEEGSVVETTALRQASESVGSLLDDMTLNDNYLTVSGTIKRGKKKEENVEVVLNMSREELEILEIERSLKNCCRCSMRNGLGFHVFLWTVLCFPLSVITSGIYSFCMGTVTWYNVFKLFSENQIIWYKISIPPLLMILYPFLIISTSLGLGLYSGMRQLSCSWGSWKKEFMDYEKGFFYWLCNFLDVPECSPYEVVILSSIQKS